MKTAEGLVNYCRLQIGKPYWYGTYGQKATQELLEYKKKQYASQYTWSNKEKIPYGVRVHDCAGLIKGYLWSLTSDSAPVYQARQDVGVKGLATNCRILEGISSLPEEPGVLVFSANYTHVGVYSGSGMSIEARGHAFGVVETYNADRQWKYWGKLNWIDYSIYEQSYKAYFYKLPYHDQKVIEVRSLLRKGCQGVDVVDLQRTLNALNNAGLETDGVFGIKTAEAVVAWQKKVFLKPDGWVGNETYASFYMK